MLNQSSKSLSTARAEIADCVGASADTEMITRATRSLEAAIEHFNNRAKWNWMLTEGTPLQVFAPFTVAITANSSAAASASAAAGHGVKIDDILLGSGFMAGTRVSATAASGITFNTTLTVSGSQTVSAIRDLYDLPTDFKTMYSVRLLQGMTFLRPVPRRMIDRSITDESQASSPVIYDLFVGSTRSKVRLWPPPSSSDVLLMRYYRRMGPTTSPLDVPQDVEPYLLAWAKWHFLVDKQDGRGEQAKIWFALAQEGLTQLLRDQTNQPDDPAMMVPGHFSYTVGWNPNSTRELGWDIGG